MMFYLFQYKHICSKNEQVERANTNIILPVEVLHEAFDKTDEIGGTYGKANLDSCFRHT